MSFFSVPDIQDTVFYWILRKWMVVAALVMIWGGDGTASN